MESKFRKLEMEELNRLNPEQLLNVETCNFCFVLDSVRSLNNVGSIFRTSDAFRVEKIWLCGLTGQPPHRDIQKTALGATETVAWSYCEDISNCLVDLKSQGYTLISIEQTKGSTALGNFVFESGKKYALILGNEVSGVSESALEHSEFVLEIPQFGAKHSLNVSVTAGIIAWEFVSQKLKANPFNSPKPSFDS